MNDVAEQHVQENDEQQNRRRSKDQGDLQILSRNPVGLFERRKNRNGTENLGLLALGSAMVNRHNDVPKTLLVILNKMGRCLTGLNRSPNLAGHWKLISSR